MHQLKRLEGGTSGERTGIPHSSYPLYFPLFGLAPDGISSLSPSLRFLDLFWLCSDATTCSPYFNGLPVFSTVFWKRLKLLLNGLFARRRSRYASRKEK